MSERASIAELELSGNKGNLRRALKRNEDEAAPLPPEAKDEIEKLDALIAQTMKACRRGSTWRKKKNPAFANLADLMRCRKMAEQRGARPPRQQSGEELLAEMDKLLGKKTN